MKKLTTLQTRRQTWQNVELYATHEEARAAGFALMYDDERGTVYGIRNTEPDSPHTFARVAFVPDPVNLQWYIAQAIDEPDEPKASANPAEVLRAAVIGEIDANAERLAEYIRKDAESTAATLGNVIKEYSTARRVEQFNAGEITRDQLAALALKRLETKTEKRKAETLAKIEKAQNAPALDSVDIIVTWARSATWGANPSATVTAYDESGRKIGTFHGRASGCGYDKRSAAICQALNACESVRGLLDRHAGEILAAGTFNRFDEFGKPCAPRALLGYGSGYGARPCFEGGCGVSIVREIFARCGFDWRESHDARTLGADFYAAERRATK